MESVRVGNNKRRKEIVHIYIEPAIVFVIGPPIYPEINSQFQWQQYSKPISGRLGGLFSTRQPQDDVKRTKDEIVTTTAMLLLYTAVCLSL